MDNPKKSGQGYSFIVSGILVLPGNVYVWLGLAVLALSIHLLIQVIKNFLEEVI